MKEYIEREALIADIEKRYCQPCEAEGKDYNHVRCRACWVDDMVGEIGEAPFYDVAPVVRCKDCINCIDCDGVPYCTHWERDTDNGGYCHEGR